MLYLVNLCLRMCEMDYLLNVAAFQYVTCGSVLKLQNTRNGVRLHSHDVKYGSGSGQQVLSIT